MIAAATHLPVAGKAAPPQGQVSAPRAAAPAVTQAPRSSAGEAAPANLRTLSAHAVEGAEQSAVAPRLRDQETAERSDRIPPRPDTPTGPSPAFQESLLERRARTALDPPDIFADQAEPATSDPASEEPGESWGESPAPPAVPPTASELAEAGFAETRALSAPKPPAELDTRG